MHARTLSVLLTSAVLFATPLSAQAPSATADARLDALIAEIWSGWLDTSPEFASSLGLAGYEGRLRDPSLAAADRNVVRSKDWLARIDAIPADGLSDAGRINRGILRRMLSDEIATAGFGQRAMNFTNREGWHQSFAGMGDGTPFRTPADIKSYVDRLEGYGRFNAAQLAVANTALKGGYVLPCSALGGTDKSISGLFLNGTDRAAAARASRYYEPFTRTRPPAVDAATWDAEAARAVRAIVDVIDPAVRKHHAWFTGTYIPKCAKADGVSAQPQGRGWYDFRVRQETTTDLTADQIHAIGLDEVKRIRAEMVAVATKAGYPTREAFIEHLRTDPQYYAKTPEELMERVARVTKTIDGKMPTLFHRLPRLPYGIREIPAEIAEGTTTAFYGPGSPAIGVSGTYYVNTSKLDQRPFWEVPALSVHEAVPGHHHQIALQQEIDLPAFRRHAAFFTAFTEGWGLYSERLGIEMGLYDTPAKDMGRLSYEMWRACRLVVDTGIHAKGWTKAQAIAFMRDNSALTDANIEAEVNRYIAWPGQALGYKIGELKIRELRTLAERELGPKFDLAAFHDRVLKQGSIPLDVLESEIKRWIAAEKAKG